MYWIKYIIIFDAFITMVVGVYYMKHMFSTKRSILHRKIKKLSLKIKKITKKPIGRKTRLEVMEQRQNTVLTEREKEKRRQEIMNIQDRKKRHEAIARNMNLFTNKKER